MFEGVPVRGIGAKTAPKSPRLTTQRAAPHPSKAAR